MAGRWSGVRARTPRGVLGACALLVVGALTSCGGGPAATEPGAPAVVRSPAATDVVGDLGVDGIGISTVAWGVHGDLVSVLVRNDTSRVLRRATASARALDAAGRVLATSPTEGDLSSCCTAYDVAPGETYGLYFLLGDVPADAVEQVTVGFPDVAFSAQDAPRGPSVTATPVELRVDATGAVVVADLETVGGAVDEAVVQARLLGPDGTFLAVVSGRWRCLRPGPAVTAYVELGRPVPAGTTVEGVSVFPLDPPGDGTTPPTC